MTRRCATASRRGAEVRLVRRDRLLYKAPSQFRSVAQSGRAPRSGRGGRRFESCHSDQLGIAGMSAQARIEAALAGAVAGGMPGVVAAARLPDGSLVAASAGVRGLDNPAPMTSDTVFWI